MRQQVAGSVPPISLCIPQIFAVLCCFEPMIGENQQFVTDKPVDVQDFRKFTNHFRGTDGICATSIKENWRMWECNRLDLQTLGPQSSYAWNSPRSLVRTALTASLHSGGEVHRSVKSFGPRHSCNLRQGTVCRRRWKFKLEFSGGEVSCLRLWGCPRNLISRELPF